MKIKLLNDGGYISLSGVDFPVVVDGRFDVAFFVSSEELHRIGAPSEKFKSLSEWAFVPDDHAVEVK